MKQLKWVLAITVLTIAASSPVFTQAKGNKMASAKEPSAEAELIALDKSWTAAELRLNDADKQTINAVVADNYFGTTPFGQVQNKTQYMAALKHSDDTDVADEYRVTFFDGGKLAVMTHRGSVNGKPTYRSTHVWVKNGNGWQLIQNHVSNIGEPPAQ
jgi:ketosteroid isomerase-like protein